VLHLISWTKSSPPLVLGGQVLLPGEIEEETRAERMANGLPIDNETWRRIGATAASLGVDIPKV
jgi:hydroxycarboxylate dehydrogenase B